MDNNISFEVLEYKIDAIRDKIYDSCTRIDINEDETMSAVDADWVVDLLDEMMESLT